jgi:hypothetical protein
MQIKKYIEMPEEILVRISEGKSVQGGMQRDPHTGKIVFTPHNLMRYKPGYKRPPKKLICQLDFGTLKESPKRYIIHDSVPKDVGIARAIGLFERDYGHAKNALIDREIMDRV